MNKKLLIILVVFLLFFYFFNKIGIVRMTTEFDVIYSVFWKRESEYKIVFIEPVGERDLHQISDNDFRHLLEFCHASDHKDILFKSSCKFDYISEEITRRGWDPLKIYLNQSSPY